LRYGHHQKVKIGIIRWRIDVAETSPRHPTRDRRAGGRQPDHRVGGAERPRRLERAGPEATRARVKAAIEQLTYVADPAARRLAGLDNQIIGVFTYEAALSPESMDFYGPLLNGIERAAEHIGWDLLFFTSSPVENGTRSLFHRKTRLRLTDGCVLLGQQMVASELERLVAEQFPFVAIGRRDETAAAVPYVAIDYVTPTTALIDQAAADGHQQALYVHRGRDTPTARDRRGAVEAASADGRLAFLLVGEERVADLPRLARATGAT
jgi:DNA-binding LacI/PurR family transcriptional regulator